MNRYADRICLTSPLHTHTSQLDGTAGRGLFQPGAPCFLHAVYAKSTLAVDWTLSVALPDPAGGPLTTYVVQTISAATSFVLTDELDIPRGGQFLLSTSSVPGSSPTAQFVYGLHKDHL